MDYYLETKILFLQCRKFEVQSSECHYMHEIPKIDPPSIVIVQKKSKNGQNGSKIENMSASIRKVPCCRFGGKIRKSKLIKFLHEMKPKHCFLGYRIWKIEFQDFGYSGNWALENRIWRN